MSEKLIIHITSNFNNIKSILKSESLRLSYSEEDFIAGNKRVSSAAHPMVCFSEFDIKNIEKSEVTYGQYGIGFSLDWARKKKISPVIYINPNSMAANGLGTLLRARRNKIENVLANDLKHAIIKLKCFTKNEKGYNSHLKKSDFNFKNENEWRFVPEKKDIGNGLISQDKSKYRKSLESKKKYNDKLLPYPMRFSMKSIKRIYVKHEYEMKELSDKFPNLMYKIEISKWKFTQRTTL